MKFVKKLFKKSSIIAENADKQKNLEIKQKRREYYQKNKHKIKQNNKRKRERDELEQKLYKYGFWLLLMAGVVNLILTQI